MLNVHSIRVVKQVVGPDLPERCAVAQRAVDDIRVAGDPANIRRAPVSVLLFQIENQTRGEMGADQVSAGGVQNTLGFARCSRSIKDEKRMFRIELLGRAIGGGIHH